MTSVTLTVTTTPTALPPGITAGKLTLSITDPNGAPVQDAHQQPLAAQQVDGTTATFADVAPGNYLAQAVRLDANGSPIGTPVTQSFSVAAPAIPASTFDAPQSITVTLA